MSTSGNTLVSTASLRLCDLALALVKQSLRQNIGPDMSEIINGARTGFLAQHMNHMNGFLLLWKVCARSCGDKVVGICTDVYVRLLGTNVHPETTQHLACTETLHQGVELRNGCGQGCSVDFMGFKLNQGALGILMLVPGFSKEDSLSTLRAGV